MNDRAARAAFHTTGDETTSENIRIALSLQGPSRRLSMMPALGRMSSGSLRRRALQLVAVMAAAGFTAGLTTNGGMDAIGSQLTAAAILAVIVAMLAAPVPGRIAWPGLVLLSPLCFAIGVRPLEHPDVFVGMLLVGITWVATYLSRPLLVTHVVAATAAAGWVLSGTTLGQRPVVATALWALVFALVGTVVASLAGALRRARAEVEEIGAAIGAHFYRGVLEPDGSYAEAYTGPGIDRLIGRIPAEHEDAGAAWMSAVHPDDLAVYTSWLGSLGPGSSDEHEYRLIDASGTTRWVLERVRVSAVDNGRVFHEGLVWDVTERRITERRLERTRRQLTDLIEAIDEVVLQYEPAEDGWRTSFVGPGLDQLVGRFATAHDPLLEATSPRERRRVAEHRAQVLTDGRGEIEHHVVDGNGAQRWISERLWVRADGDRVMVDAIASDVTERRRTAAELAAARDEAELRARTDALTGVSNRLHFAERLDAEISRLRRGGHSFGLVLLDVDRFKQLNDRHGHLAGDRALVEVAARLRRRLRPYDAIARWGGEEFAVLLPDVGEVRALASVCESLRLAVSSEPVAVGTRDVPVTISVGAVLAGGHKPKAGSELSADWLLATADEALYVAKRRGRDQIEVAASLAREPQSRVVGIAPQRPHVM